ncbi:MAG: hypothetical protein OHK0057_27460 [Thermoflexibacter sp.]
MEDKPSNRVRNKGTTQSLRFFTSLDPEYIKIDERSFEELLSLANENSKLINFYNIKDQVEGDWSVFFNDETVVLSSIIVSNPVKAEKSFKEPYQKAIQFKNIEKKISYFKEAFDKIYTFVFQFEVWLKQLKSIAEFTRSEILIHNEMMNAVSSRLGNSYLALRELDEKMEDLIGEKIGKDYSVFTNIEALIEKKALPVSNFWRLEKTEGESDQDLLRANLNFASEKMLEVFQAYYETLIYLKQKAPLFLEQSLKSNKHFPEMALYVSFLKLYKHLQDKINKFHQRYLEHYYLDYLKEIPLSAHPDQVYLKFNLDGTSPLATIEKGTQFLAGADDEGNEVIYEADATVRLNKITIEKLNNIYLGHRTLNIRGREKKIVTGFYTADILLEQATGGTKKTYSPFGEDQIELGKHEKTMQEASVGFAISSPSLFLSEGKRQVTVLLRFDPTTFPYFIEHLADLSYVSGSTEEETFIKAFLEAFKLEITIEEGWYPIKGYVVSLYKSINTIRIRFDLESSEPPITAFNKEVHKGFFDTPLPVLKVFLNSNSYTFVYSLLKEQLLEQIEIQTDVFEVKQLQIQNHISEINPSNPFYPFGTTPKVGSYMLIGNNEIFQKSLDNLVIHIEWFDLPRNENGFYGHYANYTVAVDNTVFEVSLSILDKGRWIPENPAEQQKFKLFRTKTAGGHITPRDKGELSNYTIINNIDMTSIRQPANYDALKEELVYSNTVRRGFIKLELTNPPYAFAHDIYPAVLSTITAENMKKGGIFSFGKKEEKPIPEQPYAPQIKSISLDYSSSSSIQLRDRSAKKEDMRMRGQFFHLHPLGDVMIYPDNSKQTTPLLLEYDFEGCLMIGFKGYQSPQTLTLLVEMIDEFSVSSESDPPLVEWNYLKGNEWKILPPSKILQDTTERFIKTGIIEIELPTDLDNGNTIVDPELFWIRATVTKNIDEASSLVSIYPQIATATLSKNGSMKKLGESLPPFSIQRSMDNILGIESIQQPLPSMYGRKAEDKKDFHTRIAEILRHKNRAITEWDYERLVLSKFPQIQQITCLRCMNSQSLDSPGSVLVVVVPKPEFAANPVMPMASNEILYQIKQSLEKIIGPFIKLEVRNPAFEIVRIVCSVKFNSGFSYGFYIQELNRQINQLLSPSSGTNKNGRLELGGKIFVSDLLSFMRTLPYINYVSAFSMTQTAIDFNGKNILLDTARVGEEKDFLEATKPWSVLVPADIHQIYIDDATTPRQSGVGSLYIGQDFIIG